MKASKLNLNRDYPNFPELVSYEIPLHLMDAQVILNLQELRNIFGRPIIPSPVKAGWARTHGSTTSQHYAVGRLSTAGDIFPEVGHCLSCWLVAQQIPEIKGLGLYLDTKGINGKFWPMLHFDIRNTDKRVFWIRDNGNYYTLGRHDTNFWQGIAKLIEIDKEFRYGT